jgi:hypothetical protein
VACDPWGWDHWASRPCLPSFGDDGAAVVVVGTFVVVAVGTSF